MTTIKDYLIRLSSYRNNLMKFMQLRLDDMLRQKASKNEIFTPLSIAQITKILAEIELCNHCIAYLHTWDNYYNGPVIPFDNHEIITTVEKFIKPDEINTYRLHNPKK